MPSVNAENILELLDIQKDSVLSRQILENYAKNGTSSLLESIISSSGLSIAAETAYVSKQQKFQHKNFLTLDEKLKNIDDKYSNDGFRRKRQNKNITINNGAVDSIDKRFRVLALSLERDKQIQLQIAIDK